MTKYKAGDKVKIKSFWQPDYNEVFKVNIDDIGIVGKVEEWLPDNDQTYYVYLDCMRGRGDGGLRFSGKDLELVSDKEKVTQEYDVVNKPKHYNSDPSGVIENKFNPLSSQSGGNHYKIHGVQPVEYTMSNNLSFCQGNIIKYITRYADKNGIEDLEKVIHYTLLEAYFKYGEDGSEELKQRVLKLFNK